MARPGRRAAALAVLLLAVARAAPASSASEALDRYRRGETLYGRGELEAALSEFQGALALDPKPHRGARVGMHFEDYDPQFQIGRIFAKLGRFAQARRAFEACAAAGYTERSENAEEYRRWSAAARQAAPETAPPAPSAAAPPPASQPPPPAATTAPAARTGSPVPPASPPPRTESVAAAPRSEEAPPRSDRAPAATARQRTVPPGAVPAKPPAAAPPKSEEIVAVEPPANPAAAAPQARPTAIPAKLPRPTQPAPALPWAWLAAAGAALLLGALAAWRGRRRISETDELAFRRYAIGNLLAAGRHSFVYAATDRKTRRPVALKLRRSSPGGGEPDEFEREARSLEILRRSPHTSLAPGLVGRGTTRKGGNAVEYLALERLEGTSLLDFCRNARRRLEPLLCVDILRAVVAALERAREAGVGHDELAADDVFLLEPLPANAGNPVALRVLGWKEKGPDTAAEVRGVAAIAAELFQGRARGSDAADALERAPAPLREILARVRAGEDGTLPSLAEMSAALDACRRPGVEALGART